jgi:hypothetical protein
MSKRKFINDRKAYAIHRMTLAIDRMMAAESVEAKR